MDVSPSSKPVRIQRKALPPPPMSYGPELSESRARRQTYESVAVQDTSERLSEEIESMVSSPGSRQHDQYTTVKEDQSANRNPKSSGDLVRFRSILRKFWLWEFAACLLSLLCFASIVVVLLYENGRQLNEWHSTIPPTAVVAFITLFAKGSLVMVLSQILSQLKWLNFEDARCLKQLKSFDSASRGPIGSLMLICTSRRFLATITAILMLLTLLVDPFLQTVFTFPSEPTIDSSQQSSFSSAKLFDPWGAGFYPQRFQEIWNGVNNGFTNSQLKEDFTCPTGSCQWLEDIKTLGVCGSCNNVTISLVREDCGTRYNVSSDVSLHPYDETTCSYRFPTGKSILATGNKTISEEIGRTYDFFYTLWNSSLRWDSHSMYKYNLNFTEPMLPEPRVLPISHDVFNGSMVAFEILRMPFLTNATELPDAQGYECELRWCEKTFKNVQVIGGALNYTLEDDILWSVPMVEKGWIYFFRPDQADRLQASSDPNRMPYAIRDYDKLSDYVAHQFVFSAEMLQSHFELSGIPAVLLESSNIDATFGNLGHSLTEMIRTGPNSTQIPGQTNASTTIVKIRWLWLILPLTLSVATSILLVLVAIKSHASEVAVWKDDPLALLFHRVDGIDQSLLSSTIHTGPADIANLADEVVVTLSKTRPLTFSRAYVKGEKQTSLPTSNAPL